MKRVCIIGGGIGGLATANLLAHRGGYEVTVLERHGKVGGRAGVYHADGFTFDTGPSWYLMPEVFERYYTSIGEQIENHLTLRRLEPAYKVFFEHEEPVVVTSDLERDAALFDRIEPGAGDQLKRYVKQSSTIYDMSVKHFLYTNFTSIKPFINREVLAAGPKFAQLSATSLHRYVSGFVRDRRLQQILEYSTVFLGTSPFDSPAIYSLMGALDFQQGVFYPEGGLYKIIESLEAIGARKGVSYQTSTEVSAITVEIGNVTGVELSDGTRLSADIVISNSDIHHTETKLLDTQWQTYPEKYWQKRSASPSALLMYLGVSGKIAELEHHNLLFVDDWKGNFARMAYGTKWKPIAQSMYVCRPSATDASVAPSGDENLFVLVPLAGGIYSDAEIEQMKDFYINQLERMTGISIQDRIVHERLHTPQDFSNRFFAWRQTMLGQSHLLSQSAMFRTPNRSRKVSNLYYVGANTVPGIGLPMCLISADTVVARLKSEDAQS